MPVESVKELQGFFQSLNPYKEEIQMLKEEYSDVWFYGISAKRYCLYKLNGKETEILKHSLHGLGHLLNPFGTGIVWQEQIWKDFLKLHYGWMSYQQFYAKYGILYGVSKLAVSNQELHKRVKKFNENKDYAKQIKPFGFICVGFGMKGADGAKIKPIAPFNKNSQITTHQPFLDAEKGVLYDGGAEYWRTLFDLLSEYLEHPEAKLDGDKGLLQRKSVCITDIQVIGKEAKDLDEQSYRLNQASVYHNEEELQRKILEMTSAQARKGGMKHRSTLKRLKDKIRKGERVNWKTKEIDKLVR